MTTRELAMFPLGTVVFPYSALPLHVFEPRYRALVRDVNDSDGEFGIVLIERGSEVGGGDARFDVGTLVHLVRCDPFPDGRYALVAFGVARLRVHEWLADDPYPRAVVELFSDDTDSIAIDDAELRDEIIARLQEVYEWYARADPNLSVPSRIEVSDDLDVATFELCAKAPLGALDAQALLAAASRGERLRRLRTLLDDQLVLLRARFDG